MVLDRAEPVAKLHGIFAQRVDDAVLREHVKRSVDGREPGPASRVPQPVVQLLRGQRLAPGERRQHLAALLRLASHVATRLRRIKRYASEIR